MEVRIVGRDAPGRSWPDPRPGGCTYENIHVGVQRRRDVIDLHPADTREATWFLTIDVVEVDGAIDFRGPYVQGKRGDRFVYLSWGTVGDGGTFEMFRRAKLMLGAVEQQLIRSANRPGQRLVGTLSLTGGDGGPRCAAVRPPGIDWASTSS
jgi:hypothetical protein